MRTKRERGRETERMREKKKQWFSMVRSGVRYVTTVHQLRAPLFQFQMKRFARIIVRE